MANEILSNRNRIGRDSQDPIDGNNDELPPPHTPHGRSTRSFPVTAEPHSSDLHTCSRWLPSKGTSGGAFLVESVENPQDVEPNVRCKEAPQYEDKGVMVSPWMQRLAEKRIWGDGNGENHQIGSPPVSRVPDSRTKSTDSAPFGYFETPRPFYTRSRNLSNIDLPAPPTASRRIFQDSNIVSSNPVSAIDDIPDESLIDFIQRMEREILGVGDSSTPCVDDTSLPPRATLQSQHMKAPCVDPFYDERCPTDFPRWAPCRYDPPPDGLTRRPIHQDSGWPSRPFSQLPRPTEILGVEAESASTFVWQPHHKMWY